MIRYHARWVLPVGAPPLRGGTVCVDGDRIVFVGPRASAPAGNDAELGDAILLPGLVNAHIHLDLAMFDGALAGLEFFRWVRALVRGLGEAVTGAAIADASMWSVADQLAHGVTTIGHTGPHTSAVDALHAMGARGVVYLETFGPDPAQCDGSMADLHKRVETTGARETSLVRVGVSPHAPYSVSDVLYSAVAAYARAESLPMAVHIAESADETELVRDGAGEFARMLNARGIATPPRAESPVALLERTGVLATRPLCIHAIRVSERDVARIADAGATVAHCPRANAWFAADRAPVLAYRARGVAVGIGTDSIASNDAVRILAEARDAADESLSSGERIDMVTRGGATALGLAAHIGSLAPGMQADLAAFAAEDTSACDADPERFLLDRCAGHPALLTVVAGKVCAQNGRAVNADASLDARLAENRARIVTWAAQQDWRRPRTHF